MIRSIKNIALALAAVSALAGAASAQAQTPWQADHARRAEVNHRLAVQDHRIHHLVRTGQISPARAAYLHHEDRRIRHEERSMARFHGGHVTRAEQHALNRQENAVGRQIVR